MGLGIQLIFIVGSFDLNYKNFHPLNMLLSVSLQVFYFSLVVLFL